MHNTHRVVAITFAVVAATVLATIAEENVATTLSLEIANWNPSTTSELITLNWNYQSDEIELNEIVQVVLFLSISSDVEEISTFNLIS